MAKKKVPFQHGEIIARQETGTAEEEGRFHNYMGNDIPWYVRLMWIAFWIFAIYYMFRYFMPAIQIEIDAPP